VFHIVQSLKDMSSEKEQWVMVRKKDIDFILDQLQKIKDEAKGVKKD